MIKLSRAERKVRAEQKIRDLKEEYRVAFEKFLQGSNDVPGAVRKMNVYIEALIKKTPTEAHMYRRAAHELIKEITDYFKVNTGIKYIDITGVMPQRRGLPVMKEYQRE